jgi:hypothetical protein
MILVVTTRRASEADRVIKHLRKRGADVVRVNTGPAESTVTIEDGAGPGWVRCDGRRVRLSEARAAWLHQRPRSAPLGPTPSAVAAASSTDRLWEAALDLVPGASWWTKPESLELAANKVRQARWAHEAGLRVPPTVVSNDPAVVRSTVLTHPLLKYLGDSVPLWGQGDHGYATRTVRASLGPLSDWAIAVSPALYQAQVSSPRELRVVVVRGSGRARVFAAGAPRPAGVIDLRFCDDVMATFVPCELHEPTRGALLRLLEAAGLGFCSADLLVDQDGEHLFVDLNPTGAWWWIDDLYGGDVTRAICDTLEEIGHR